MDNHIPPHQCMGLMAPKHSMTTYKVDYHYEYLGAVVQTKARICRSVASTPGVRLAKIKEEARDWVKTCVVKLMELDSLGEIM